jgi:hypothetical protein
VGELGCFEDFMELRDAVKAVEEKRKEREKPAPAEEMADNADEVI